MSKNEKRIKISFRLAIDFLEFLVLFFLELFKFSKIYKLIDRLQIVITKS